MPQERVNWYQNLEILTRLPFKIVSSERIRLVTFSNNLTLQLICNSRILIKVSNWGLKRRLIDQNNKRPILIAVPGTYFDAL